VVKRPFHGLWRERDVYHSRRPLMRSAGFTLIELIAVMVVVSLLSAVVVPTLSDMTSARQASAGTRLLHDLNQARQITMARGVRTWVTFDTTAESYTLFIEDADNPGRANRSVMDNQVQGGTFTVALNTGLYNGGGIDSVSLNGGAEVGFDYLGRPLDESETLLAANGSVTLVGSHVITITARTGYMSLSSGP